MKFQSRLTWLLLLVAQLSFSSCLKKIALNSLGAFDDKIPVKFITNGEKKLIFFPMHHIGKKIFYDDVRFKIDSCMKNGYVVYFEGVRLGPVKDSTDKDSLFRKARKITGIDFITAANNKGYIDTTNNTLMGIKTKYISKYKLMNQPWDIIPKPDSLKVKNVDASFVQMVDESEKKYGRIILERYDFEIKFGEKYQAKENQDLKKYFLTGFRNALIIKSILSDSNSKIILLYGADHFEGILEDLIAADKNYKQVKKL